MKKHSTPIPSQPGAGVRGRLRLVRGGQPRTASAPVATAFLDPVRTPIVDRARQRLAAGYYGRPEVVERLVELLWDEFHVR